MGFKILTKEEQPISINRLDEEVCKLWEVELDKSSYARPKCRTEYDDGLQGSFDYARQTNWFDSVGWAIHQGNDSWYKVTIYFIELYQDILDKYNLTLNELEPKLCALIKHWEDKGYQPISVK